MSFNDRGKVSNVAVLQSTGSRRFDEAALDTLRGWRIKPGAAREVELALVTVLSGKVRPTRVRTSAGSMTSG